MTVLFSKIIEHNVLPKKRYLVTIIVASIALLLLYMVAFILYFLTLFKSQQYILVVISTIEIILTAVSILISLLATYISDYTNTSCMNIIEDINRKNEPLFKNDKLTTLSYKTKKLLKSTRWIKFFVLTLFALYFISCLIYYVCADSTVIQLLTVTLSSISTVATITMALVSSVSCFITGKYTQAILHTLNEDNKRLFDLYNKYKIDQSYIKSSI